MDKQNRNRRIISLSIVLFIVMLLVSGGSYAYWTWSTATSEQTNVALTVTAPNMSATLSGYTQTVSNLIPVSSCTDSTYAIKKELVLTYENFSDNVATIKGTLSIESFTSPNGTPDSDDLSHLHYAVTTSGDSCTTDVVRGGYGTFTSTSGSLFTDITLKGAVASGTSETSTTYYLWVWLDSEYTHVNVGSGVVNDPMQDISFTLVWTGALSNDESEPEQPVLDEGMIPVTIANNGTVTTIAEYDLDWYDYSSQEWANVVLVDSDSRDTYKGTSGKTVTQSDILAYYTWIPRYSYRIPLAKCSDIDSPNVYEHAACYSYSVSSSDKNALINYLQDIAINTLGITNYTQAQATTEVEEGLQTGILDNDNSLTLKQSMYDFMMLYYIEEGEEISYTTEFMPNYLCSTSTEIDISFELGTSQMIYGDAVNTYRTHPAFWWDNDSDGVVDTGETKSGIWVGKFETGHSTLSSSSTSNNLNCTNENCTNSDGLIIKPNVVSLRYNSVSNQFYASRSMTRSGNPFGLTTKTDSHMMKNSEWGAVAYLSHSQYGINTEIRINNNSNYTTGCGASSENGDSTTECEIVYAGASSYPQSTTGNITGIFDMSGGSGEAVMGILADDNGNPRSGRSSTSNSGFNGLVSDDTSYTSGINFPEKKYFDLYTSTDSSTACDGEICYGHALSETAEWYNDNFSFVNTNNPWVSRSALYASGSDAGAFGMSTSYGPAFSSESWRAVLVVE